MRRFAPSQQRIDAQNRSHGRAAVALPGGAPRRVGLRLGRSTEPRVITSLDSSDLPF